MGVAEKDQAVRSRPWTEQNAHLCAREKDVVDQNVSTWTIVGQLPQIMEMDSLCSRNLPLKHGLFPKLREL
jgi:hypothetical protein